VKSGNVFFFVINWNYNGKHGPTPEKLFY